MSSSSQWMEINQSVLPQSAWQLWKQANRLWSNSTGQLYQPLGYWIRDLRHRRIRHFAYKYRRKLYVKAQEGYMECTKTRAALYAETERVTIFQDLPNRARPSEVSTTRNSNMWRLIHATRVVTIEQDIRPSATFEDFLNALDVWEYDLLRHTVLSIDPFTVSSQHDIGFTAGSDGSEKYGTDGAFGWALSTNDGVRTAWGMGPSRGLRMDSYRAECSGMLSILRFLVRLGEYTNKAEEWSGIIGTDSQSMLKTLFGQANVQAQIPLGADHLLELDVMIAEWDLLIEIQTTLKTLPAVHLVHVKGHQDKESEYSTLPLLAQLNVEADTKAREYQADFGKAHPCTLLSPNAGVLLHFPEGTITAKVIPEVRRRVTGPPLQQYIQQRNHWSEQTMRVINWKAHAKALGTQIQHRVHFTKLVHDCLPTNHQLNKFTSENRKFCPACHLGQDETRDHILRCTHEDRVRWRVQFHADIQAFHTKESTSPVLQHLWRDAIHQWFITDENEEFEVSPILFPTEVRRVIQQQNQIGWRQVFNGRFASEWASVQEAYYSRTIQSDAGNSNKRRTGLRWQQRFIHEIWKSWRKLWKLRNETVHGKDKVAQLRARERSTMAELQTIYDKRTHLEPPIQRLLFTDVQEHMQRPPGVTRNWLNINRPVFQSSLRRAKRQAIQGVRSIQSYFAPVRTFNSTSH
jgi:hypothetical protein